jgi:hypothetical protein
MDADPVKLYRTMTLFADARTRRLRALANGEHVCPPFPTRCEECHPAPLTSRHDERSPRR